MDWKVLESQETFTGLTQQPSPNTFAIFKHSTSCPVSAAAKKRLAMAWEKKNKDIPIYYLDLLQNRSVSNEVADRLEVVHQSPQLIVVKNGAVVYHASHLSINSDKVAEAVSE